MVALGVYAVLDEIVATLSPVLGGIYVALGIVFGLVWLGLNAYQFYPLLRSIIGGLRGTAGSGGRATESRPIGDGSTLPSIDLLLPAYDEAGVIEEAIRSVTDATYPSDRLELHVLIEPDDIATAEKLRSLVDDYPFTIHEIPEGYPGQPNKPRALNYGFCQSNRDIVGVIDAEDVVAPDLFREVAEAFRDGTRDYVLGRLDMANEVDGWLNLLFRAEYGFWYALIVPSFTRAGYPIPLGGTSCFFRRDTLESIAERRVQRYGSPWNVSDWLWLVDHGLYQSVPWDPQNVTEDFELGLFLWEEGYRFRYLDAVTAEESPVSLDGWLRQRTRWQKGKLQTFRNYLREPPSGLRRKAHLLWQSALPHIGPVNVLGVGLVFWLAVVLGIEPGRPLRALLGLGLIFFLTASLLFVTGYWSVSDQPLATRGRRAAIVAGTVPFYWLLQWLADIHALSDLYRGRLDWAPSEHLGRHLETTRIAAAAYVDRPPSRSALGIRSVVPALGVILTIGFVLRGFALDKWSLWHDEIYTIQVRGGAALPDLVMMTSDPHPPLYYALAHGWMTVVGSAPTSMRMLSIVFSLGTVVGVFLLGASVYDNRIGLVAALLVGVSTTHIHFGRTVRMYSLFTMLAAVSWYLYAELRSDGRCFSWLPRSWKGKGAGYVVITTGLLYTHVYGLFVVASQFVVQWFAPDGRVDRREWWTLQALIGILFAPWAVVIGHQWLRLTGADSQSPIGWIPPPSMGQFRETMLLFGGYPSIYPIDAGSTAALFAVVLTLFVVTAAVLLSVVTYDPDNGLTYYLVGGKQAAMLGTFAAAIFIPFGLSYVTIPVFVPRYALVGSLPLFVLVARGLENVPEKRWRVLLLAIVLAGSLTTTGLYYSSETSADWRGISAHLATESSDDDLVVFQPTWVQDDVRFYAPELAASRYPLRPDDRLTEGDITRLRELVADHETVWLVRHETADADRALAELQASHRVVDVVDGGVVTLYRLDNR